MIEELFNFGFVQFRSLQLKPLPTQAGFHHIIIIVDENRVNLFEKLFYINVNVNVVKPKINLSLKASALKTFLDM